jgi:uncharacterized protein YkwD
MRCVILFVFLVNQISLVGQFNIAQYDLALKVYAQEEMNQVLCETAKRFEEKLTTIRKKNRAKELKHLNQAWLMALNHCLWMREHKNLTHSERKNTKYYTGNALSQRLAFVHSGAQFDGLGENIAYTELPDEEITDPAILAETLAEDFFQLWKDSAPHRKNMIEKSYTHHGLVFLKSGKRIYGVQVFYTNH